MVAIECLVVVLPLVAEEPAELLDPVAPLDEPVPIIMADLVPEVAQERAVILFEGVPPPLAVLGVVGLGHIDGDHPVGMPGSGRALHRRIGVGIGEELERQARFGSSDLLAKGRSKQSRL